MNTFNNHAPSKGARHKPVPVSEQTDPNSAETAGRRAAFRRFIARRGFTAAGSARHAGMVSANAIHNFLNGHSRSLSQRTLEKFLAAFPDATADELFGRDVQVQ